MWNFEAVQKRGTAAAYNDEQLVTGGEELVVVDHVDEKPIE
jgi:predicted FMN-binding regulatory protein PaiB